MATNRKLSNDILSDDANSFAGLKTITNYKPSNPLYTVEAIETVEEEMKQLQMQYVQLSTQVATVYDNMLKKEWEFHERTIGAKTSVAAQYGRDSDEVQIVGKKKISDYKKRGAQKKETK